MPGCCKQSVMYRASAASQTDRRGAPHCDYVHVDSWQAGARASSAMRSVHIFWRSCTPLLVCSADVLQTDYVEWCSTWRTYCR